MGLDFTRTARPLLGMRRLAIIDVAGSQQPVYNEDRTVAAVFNGEIYNFPELREQLRARGHSFTTNGDSECLVHLYEDYGDDLVHRLRGMFAFAIWDAAAKRLLLARDRVGKKPLYWREDGDSLAFGSELKALLADPALTPSLDLVALHHYLTYQYVPAPWSIFEGIRKLPPGHLLVMAGRGRQGQPLLAARLHRAPRRVRSGGSRTAAVPAARRHQGADAQRTTARRVPVRRRRLVRGGRRDGSPDFKTGQDLLHRLRGTAVRRAGARETAGRVLRHRPPGIRRDTGLPRTSSRCWPGISTSRSRTLPRFRATTWRG